MTEFDKHMCKGIVLVFTTVAAGMCFAFWLMFDVLKLS